jgi:hypothetical protein
VVHLDKLDEEMKDKGLTVIALTRQDRGAVDKFIEETGAKHTIVIESSDSMRSYGATGWPTSLLIGPGGRILFRGTVVPDSKINETLESVKILPAFPKSLKAARKAFDKNKYADVQKVVTKALEGGKLEDADKTAAEGIGEWIDWYANSVIENAGKDIEAGNFYEAWLAYSNVSKGYKGAAIGTRAAALAKELLADADKKKEIKAGDKLAKIRVKIRDMSPKKALKALAPMASRKLRDTAAGKQAAALIKQYESAK